LKISIISPFTFGYIEALVEKISAQPNYKVTFINISNIQFHYSNLSERLNNFLLKLFLNRNLKSENIENEIESRIKQEAKQNYILIIRPDKFSRNHLKFLKTNTEKLIVYLFDAIASIPDQLKNLDLFDEVYSYELEDVTVYNFKFITNFIPLDYIEPVKGTGLFNISSFDERFPIIQKVAKQIKDLNYPYKIVIKKDKIISCNYVDIITEYWNMDTVSKYILDSAILLDIQKEGQHGLSFRIFEGLGTGKKIITTNKSVSNYDFYRPENILIIDSLNPIIPMKFLDEKAIEIPESIKSKYRREAWIKTIFS
tara:strand:+ start:1186 stop:2121 length:936 start_codon:yes stop_codon:yes gene_type:complete